MNWIIVFGATVYGLEHFLRFALLTKHDPLHLGRALSRLYRALAYADFPVLPAEVRSLHASAAVILLVTVDLFYLLIELYARWKGIERRDCWIKFLH